MPSPRTRPRPRLSAAVRREQLVDVALPAFAETGLNGTSTEAIARDAGVSHAYVFRLFGTKKDLFLACAERCCGRIMETFRAAAVTAAGAASCSSALPAMGRAYQRMLDDRELLQMQMQLWAACSDEDVRAAAGEQYGRVFEEVERLSGAGPVELRDFMAKGMLLNVAAAMRLPDLAGEQPWVGRLLHPPEAPNAAAAANEPTTP